MSDHTPPRSTPASTSAAAELQELLLSTDDITGFLDELVGLAATVLPGDRFCGITLRRDRGVTTVASSDAHLEQPQRQAPGHRR